MSSPYIHCLALLHGLKKKLEKGEDLVPLLAFLLVVCWSLMELKGFLGLFLALNLVVLLPGFVIGGDIVHEDDEAPKQPGCSNNFVLVRLLRLCLLLFWIQCLFLEYCLGTVEFIVVLCWRLEHFGLLILLATLLVRDFFQSFFVNSFRGFHFLSWML